MKYKTSRKEFYESRLHDIAPELAELLDKGFQVEISQSRSGIKVFSISKKHHVIIAKGGNAND